MLDERCAGPIDHLEHQIESVGATVVGIGYIEVAVLMGVERSEERERSASTTLGLGTQIPEIAAVHREDVVEFLEVDWPYAAGPSPECDPVPRRDVAGAWVWWLSFVPGACAGRVDADAVGKPLLFQTVCQGPFC